MTELNLGNPACIPSLKLLGDFWTLRIIDALGDQELHYSQLGRHIGNISTVTLCSRLRKLEANGLLVRNEQSRADVTYKLTALGQKVLPILDAVNNFSVAAKKADHKA